MQAAFARGEGASSILWHEILPNAWPPIIVECGLRVTFAILLGSALSFLGLGPQPPSSEWGLMIAESREFPDAGAVGRDWRLACAFACFWCRSTWLAKACANILDPHLSGRAHG